MISMALGRTKEEAHRDNLHHVSRSLVGQMGLLFTNTTKDETIA